MLMPMSFGKPCGWFGDKYLICRILALLNQNRVRRLFLRPVTKQKEYIGVMIDKGYLGDPKSMEMLQRYGV